MGYRQELFCPRCKGNNLHHIKIQVYERNKEDDEIGRRIDVAQEQPIVVNNSASMADNPSSRRDGFTITFYCETCDDKSDMLLKFDQHKGTTYLEWGQGS